MLSFLSVDGVHLVYDNKVELTIVKVVIVCHNNGFVSNQEDRLPSLKN